MKFSRLNLYIRLLALSLFAVLMPQTAKANRAIMEGIPASSSTIYVDTVNIRIGISTAIPQSTLDINGDMRISSAMLMGTDPGTYGYQLISSGPGHSPFWQAPVAYGLIYYESANASDITGFNVLSSTGQASISTVTVTNAVNGVIISTFATAVNNPGTTLLPSGRYTFHGHFAQTSGTKTSYFYVILCEYSNSGVFIGTITTTGLSGPLTGSDVGYDSFANTSSPYMMASSSSRLVIKIVLSISGGGSAPTISHYYGDGDDSHVSLPSNNANLSNLVPYTGATGDVNLGSNNLTNTSSVTASAFFGDGSHLTGITSSGAQLASTQTFSGSDTFSGTGVTTTTIQNQLNMSAGSTISFFSTAISTQLDISALTYTTPNTGVLGVCVPGSSVTWSDDGSFRTIDIPIVAGWTNSASLRTVMLTGVVNGQFVGLGNDGIHTNAMMACQSQGEECPLRFQEEFQSKNGLNTACVSVQMAPSFNFAMTFNGFQSPHASSKIMVLKR